jgi:prevent-host-death family protein
VATTGLRELRQQASDLVRQAEAGDTITVTVSGREVALLGPVRRNTWRRSADIAELFADPTDASRATPESPGAGSPTRALLDASILLGPDPGLPEVDVAISAITLAQLHEGALKAESAADRAELLRRVAVAEKTFDALPVDDAVAREYGRLASIAGGARIPVADLLVAATASAHGAALWTRRLDAFAAVHHVLEIHAPA